MIAKTWIENRYASADFQRFLGVTSAAEAAKASIQRCTPAGASEVDMNACTSLRDSFLRWLEADLGLPPGSSKMTGAA